MMLSNGRSSAHRHLASFATVLAVMGLAASSAEADIFEGNRSAYLARDWSTFGPGDNGYDVWGYLESGAYDAANYPHFADEILISWATPNPNSPDYADYGYAWNYGAKMPHTLNYRLIKQYGDQLHPDTLAALAGNYPGNLGPICGNENNEWAIAGGWYLYCLDHPTTPYLWPASGSENTEPFSYGGNSYGFANSPQCRPGETCDCYPLARDWFYAKLDNWARNWNVGGNENDSQSYTHVFYAVLQALIDLGDAPLDRLGGLPDPEGVEMAKRARMVMDLVFLDNVLDYGANALGGYQGRTYWDSITYDKSRLPFDVYFDLYATRSRPEYYVNGYRLPPVIEDIGLLDDEADDYWHLNRENRNAGKSTFVTKTYTLGGSTPGTTDNFVGWHADLSSKQGPPTPFTVFLNDDDTYVSTPPYGYANALGEHGFQYRNVAFVRGFCSGLTLHTINPVTGGNDFDQIVGVDPATVPFTNGYVRSGWEFTDGIAYFREGSVAVAVHEPSGCTSAIEIVDLDVEYPGQGLAGFQQAMSTTSFPYVSSGNCPCDSDHCSCWSYVSSEGHELVTSWDHTAGAYRLYVTPAGESASERPLPINERLAAEDNGGTPIVSWSGQQMTVERHDCRRVYDFGAWSAWDENGPGCAAGPCTDTCAGKECGFNNCGEPCGGECAAGMVCAGNFCAPDSCDCGSRICGDNGCGESCGECGEGSRCTDDGQCVACDCGERECGEDACGNLCGECDGGVCRDNRCVGDGAYWPLENRAATDYGAYGLDGTVVGAEVVTGRCGDALRFGDLDSYVEIPDHDLLDLNHFTLEAWVLAEELVPYMSVINKANGPAEDGSFLTLLVNEQGQPYVWMTAGGERWRIHGETILTTNRWTHLAATYDGSRVRIYVDGVEDGSGPATGTLGVSDSPLYLGKYTAEDPAIYFHGSIDEVRIFDHAVSAAQIAADAEACDIDSAGPVITHLPVAGPVVAGSALRIEVTINDGSGIAEAWVHYRTGAEVTFTGIAMAAEEGGLFAAYLPGSAVRTPVVEYYFEAVDASFAGNRSLLPILAADHPFGTVVDADGIGPGSNEPEDPSIEPLVSAGCSAGGAAVPVWGWLVVCLVIGIRRQRRAST